MSTLRVSNIEAKADPSSPSVDEKLKVTNSNGDILVHIDGKTAGVTTIGINTTDRSFTVDAAQNVEFLGIVTATKFSLSGGGEITGGDGNFTGIVTSGSGNFTGGLSVGTAVTAATANFTSSLTAASANFTGNVSIAGTLTYEDVTNVDSIGIATARDGIDVTGGHIDLVDDSKIRVGTGDDLDLYHDATDTYLRNQTGQFLIRGNDIKLQSYLGENYATLANNNAVSLYYDNSKKLETTTTGAKVTGALEVTQEYPSIRPTLDLNFAATKTLDRRITFTRDSVGTYVGDDGLIKYASNNTPRFDHDPTTGESLGLLIEESRTNILGLSSDLTDNNGNDWDNINGTISVNQTTAPDGTTTAASFTASAGNAEHSVVFAELVPTGNVTASVWVKPNTYSIVSFVLYGEANSTVSYNLSTETVYNQGSNVSRATITEYPNGWYRISATMNCTVSNSRVYRLFASTGNFNAGGSESFYYWGPQVESGNFETSYIPTYVSNTSVTRDDDDAVIKGTDFTDFYNETEGTLFAEFNTEATSGNVSKWVMSMRQPDNNNNYIAMTTYNTAKQPITINNNGSSQAGITGGGNVVAGVFNRMVGSYKLNDVDAAVDGTLLTPDTNATMPTGLTQMDIGRGWTNSDQKLEGRIKSIKYYNKKLPDAQLQGLTQQ
jgi:hypothetical protein